ncbi:MAG: hypothetical protein QNJ77_04485 [Acidimicrobiia bacterium]|nr:hypothetical protein [Acidimicrobiia bacterium]
MRIGKLLAAVFGVTLVVGSFAMAAVGTIALIVPDDEGWISAGPVRMRTEAVGFVGEDIHIDFGDHVGNGRTVIGWDAIPARFEVDSRNGKEIFVGVAAEDDVRTYLDGVAMDRVESLHHDPDLVHVQGAWSVEPPHSQDFWVATGIDGELEWNLDDGNWAVVVLNADGTAGVDVAVSGSAKIPFLEIIGLVLVGLGLVGMAVGGLLAYYGVRAVREPGPTPGTAPPAQPVASA